MIFYFSGTGNSQWVAKQLASQLGDTLIPMADEEALNEVYACAKGERVGFVFPVYAWSPPKVVPQKACIQNKLANPSGEQ